MDTRTTVREFYSKVAEDAESGCCSPGCCSPGGSERPEMNDLESLIGYTPEQLAKIPDEANLGLGCGTPTGSAGLQPGHTVVDLGSGAGIDCFLAASEVGASGHVIGIDMTPTMLARARRIATENGHENVEFRLGEIEHLPIADATADVVISNCVVNLSSDKQAVFDEVFRVLKPGGRVSISDIVAIAAIPEELKTAAEAIAGCVGNAEHIDTVRTMLEHTGFGDIRMNLKPESAKMVNAWIPGAGEFVASATITASKPS